MRPPAPFTARPATPADAAGIAAVATACEAAFSPEPLRFGEREIELEQRRAAAAVVVDDEEGHVVAYGRALLRGDVLDAEAAVVPACTGRGIGAFLVGWVEATGGDLGARALRLAALARDDAARELLEERGLSYVRSFYRMMIDLGEPPPAPAWPDGVTVDRLRAGEERVLHEAIEDSFAEHWGHVPRDFDEWLRSVELEPELTFLAREGDEVAGVSVCHRELYGTALVGILGVRKPWRGRGLGRALLRHSFRALYGAGKRRIGLGVDAGNETGAVALYESVGMWIAGQDDVYEKRL